MTSVDGYVAPGFERVRDAFVSNFEHNGDVGAAVCVYHRGRKVPGGPSPLDAAGPAARGWAWLQGGAMAKIEGEG